MYEAELQLVEEGLERFGIVLRVRCSRVAADQDVLGLDCCTPAEPSSYLALRRLIPPIVVGVGNLRLPPKVLKLLVINRGKLGEFDLVNFRVFRCSLADKLVELRVSEHGKCLLSTGLLGLGYANASALVSYWILAMCRLPTRDLFTVRIGTVSIGGRGSISYLLLGSFDCRRRGGLADLARLLVVDPGDGRCVCASNVLDLSEICDPLLDGSSSSHPREVLSQLSGRGRVDYHSFNIVDMLLLFINVIMNIVVMLFLFLGQVDSVRVIVNVAILIHVSRGDHKQFKIVVR